MSQRRKIAIAYLLAVPVVLVVVLLEHSSLFRVNDAEDQLTRAAGVVSRSEAAVALLKDAQDEGYQYVATGKDAHLKAYEQDATQIPTALSELRDLARNPRDAQAKAAVLESLVSKQAGALEKAVRTRMASGSSTRRALDLANPDARAMEEISKALAEIAAAEQPALEQRQTARAEIQLANAVTTYGGGLVIWLVGLAAFLLFHDEKARAWAGVERRVHTKILDIFPLGVSLTTDDGVILYANRAEESLLGYRRGELIGKNLGQLAATGHGDAGPSVDQIIDRLGPHEVWSGELALRKSDESTVRAASWMMGLEVPGKSFRVVVHNAAGAETIENPADFEMTSRWRATFQS
jgi:PAS domain S-box-containing protein